MITFHHFLSALIVSSSFPPDLSAHDVETASDNPPPSIILLSVNTCALPYKQIFNRDAGIGTA